MNVDPLRIRLGGLDNTLVRQEELKPRTDLTFRVLDGLRGHDIDARQSLLNGALLRGCAFTNVQLARCDLEQTQFQKCTFERVNFENVEMTSARIENCSFVDCSFDDALVQDCIWKNSIAQNCSFRKSLIHSTQFENCRLTECPLTGASVQLNTFRNTWFVRMMLGNCTFLNQLMIGCNYAEVQMNAESIGVLFGILEKDLASLQLVYLGQPVVDIEAKKGMIHALEGEYEKRRWMFMREMLRLNFHLAPTVVALNACLEAILWPSTFGAPIKGGDVEFFEMVILELFRNDQLPGITAMLVPDRIRPAPEGTIDALQEVKLQRLANRCRELLYQMLERLSKELQHFDPRATIDRADIRFLFERKPDLDLVATLNSFAEALDLGTAARSRILEEKSGSYLAIVETTLTAIAGMQLGLWLLNGCVAQMIELKARVNVLSQRRIPKRIQNRVLLPHQDVPKWMLTGVQNIFSGLFSDSAHLTQIANEFRPENLKQVQIQKKRHPGR